MSATAAGSSDSTLTPAPAKKKSRRAHRLRMSTWVGSSPSYAVAAGALDASVHGADGRSARDETPEFVEPSMGPPPPITTSLAPVYSTAPKKLEAKWSRPDRRMTGRSAGSGLEGRKRALDPTPGVGLGRTLDPGPWTHLKKSQILACISPWHLYTLLLCKRTPPIPRWRSGSAADC